MEFTQIKDMAKNINITGYYIVKNMNIKTSANNKTYGDYTLADSTGEINAKLWEIVDEKACPGIGTFLKVKGLVTEWQGRLQLRMDKFREVDDKDPVDISEFVPAAPEQPSDMLAELKEYIKNVEDPDLSRLLIAVVSHYAEKLPYYPAALKNHHSIRSGLLYHTLTMLRVADGLLPIYDFLNGDLLRTGIILHDIAKTIEMDAGNTGIATGYNREGMLLGHITQGIVVIDRLGREQDVDEEKLTMVEHMVLSHHYEPEYGSPKRPMFPEAEMLHHLDMIDSKMYDMKNITSNLDDGDFSETIWTLNNRKIYKSENI